MPSSFHESGESTGGSLEPSRIGELLKVIFEKLHAAGEAQQEQARAQVWKIAQNLRRYCAEENSTPPVSIAKARKALLDEARQCEELAQRIDINEPFLGLGGATENPFDDPDIRKKAEAEHEALIQEQRSLKSSLERQAALLRERATRWPTTGGRLNIYTMSHGAPMQRFVSDGCLVFAKFRPDKVSGTPGGDFYEFVAAAYELATGNGADEPGVGLDYYVRKAANRYKKAASPNQR